MPRLDSTCFGGHALLELGGRGAGLAQARGEAVDQAGDVLALGDQPLGQRGRLRRVAFEQRVGERPDRRLGGVGDHRFEVGGARPRPPPPPRAPGAPARCAGAPGWRPCARPGCGPPPDRAQKPRRLRVGDQHARHLARLRRLELVDLPARRLDRLRPASPALWRGRSAPRSGRAAGRRAPSTTGVELAVAPALDPVGEQVAPRLGQRHRRDRRQQRLVVGRAPALARARRPPARRRRRRLRRGPRRRARVASIFA